MKDIFDVLADIRLRPAMFVGGDDSDRQGQLRRMETLLDGYSIAIRVHTAPEPVPNFVRSFSDWLRDRFQWDVSLGPIAAIERHSKDPEDAWKRFWTLVDEYGAEIRR
jgi:hypothetical protein